MLLSQLGQDLAAHIKVAAQELYGINLDTVAVETPPRIELGDAAFPLAFDLVRRIKQATGEKRNPRAIAEDLARVLRDTPGVGRVEVAGAGYLNVFYDRALLLSQMAGAHETARQPAPNAPKRMVEHTSINPNKAAHIGHLRNSVLGDTLVRLLRAAGERVEVQNYIDNTGVQVADVVVGFIHLENKTLADIKALDAALTPDYPFDYYCWDLYAKVGLYYRDGDANAEMLPARKRLREETLHLIEEGGNATAELADYVATRNVQCILRTMERLGIRYDLLPRESEILRLKFWLHAFEQMRARGVIHYETEGRNAGCWVMPLELHAGTDEHDADKILVRSNGTVTYTGKDIAYQLWKLGQLDLDFHYKLFQQYPDGQRTYITTDVYNPTDPTALSDAPVPAFGHGATVYNVIDTRQSYPQKIVKLGVAAVAPNAGSGASVHLSYEMVALSPAAAAQLGFKLSEADSQRAFVEMSGRKGLGVKADDLITQLEVQARQGVETRETKRLTEDANYILLDDDTKQTIAHHIAVAALRYFLLKYTRNTVIAFDFAEALAFNGESGPACQYAAVRANAIFRKRLTAETQTAAAHLMATAETNAETRAAVNAVLHNGATGDEIWGLATLAARLEDTIEQAVSSTEPAYLAKYAFTLAKTFSNFYQQKHNNIAREPDPVRQAALIAAADVVRRQLTKALAVLGISVPEQM